MESSSLLMMSIFQVSPIQRFVENGQRHAVLPILGSCFRLLLAVRTFGDRNPTEWRFTVATNRVLRHGLPTLARVAPVGDGLLDLRDVVHHRVAASTVIRPLSV